MEGEYTTSDEKRWVEQAKQGNGAAFAQLYTHYERQIHAHIYRMMGNADDASDLTQDTFLKAYKGLVNTAPDLNVSAWLYRIAHNACMDQLRRQQRVRWQPWDVQKHDDLLHVSAEDHPERAALRQEVGTVVQRVLDHMSPINRAALVMREYDALGLDEIGLALGKSRSAMKSILFRAREEFRKISVEMGLDAPLEDDDL